MSSSLEVVTVQWLKDAFIVKYITGLSMKLLPLGPVDTDPHFSRSRGRCNLVL
jgi:hypothetical protein